MNQEKVGKFISKLRKEKKYTQANLAEMLNVSSKTISKWETGNGLPDIFMLKELAEVLEVSPLELINGNKIERVDKYKDIDGIYKSAEKYLMESKKKYKRKIVLIIIAFSVIFTIIALFLILLRNYNNCFIYSLKGNNDYYLEGFVVDSIEKDIISINNVKSIDYSQSKKICFSYDYSLNIGDTILFQSGNILDDSVNNEPLLFDEVLKKISIYYMQDSNYDTILENQFEKQDVFLSVNCLDKKGEINNFKIPIEKKMIFSNNKFLFNKGRKF